MSIIVQQDATIYSLFISAAALHVSGGISTHHQELITVSTVSGIIETVPATCRNNNNNNNNYYYYYY